MGVGRWDFGPGPLGPWGFRGGARVDLDRLCRWSWMMRTWMIVTLVWSLGVTGYFFKEVRDQVLANDEITAELAQLDCPAGQSCAAPAGGGIGSFRQVAATFLAFGFRPLFEAVIAPPAVLFLAGCGLVAILRRRRSAAASAGEAATEGFLPLAYEGVDPAE